MGVCGSDLDFRLEHGGNGSDRKAPGALDRDAGIGHDRYPQSARWYQSSFVGKVLLALDDASYPGPNSLDRSFLVLCRVRPDSVGRGHGHGVCFWKPVAPARPPQMDPHARDLRDGVVLRAPWDQSLRKWYCRTAVRMAA